MKPRRLRAAIMTIGLAAVALVAVTGVRQQVAMKAAAEAGSAQSNVKRSADSPAQVAPEAASSSPAAPR